MTRYPVLLAILCMLASCGSSSAASSTSSATAASAKCGPASSRTLAHSSQGRVYVQTKTVYGCAVGGSRPVRLGGTGPCPGASNNVGLVAVAGKKAAYTVRTCGVDTSSTLVIVRRLSDGRLLSSHAATEGSPAPESFESVGSIVVNSSGAVAWIGSVDSIATHHTKIQVLEQSGGSVRTLDQGSSIKLASLKLNGSKLSWEHGGSRQSASLG